jgi:hypothetical protein
LGQYIDRSTKTDKRSVAERILLQWRLEIEQRSFTAVQGEATFRTAAEAYVQAGGEITELQKLIDYLGDVPLRLLNESAIEAAALALFPGPLPQERQRQVYIPIAAVLRYAGRHPRLVVGAKSCRNAVKSSTGTSAAHRPSPGPAKR